MENLSMFLPPFSPDYSGVCSALFDFNALIIIHDAAGCTSNYTGFDEPRWFGSQKAIYCSGLRKIDAVMGNENKLIHKISKAAKSNDFDFIAIVGSPVPMVIGTDFKGLAKEIENETGLPTFGFSTNGTHYYNDGAAMATIALLERFGEITEKQKNTVNIVGANPLDISEKNLQDFISILKDMKKKVAICACMGATMEDIKNSSGSSINIAISQSGVQVADYMEGRFKIPYLCGIPIGEKNTEIFFERLNRVEAFNKSEKIYSANKTKASTLIIGDAVYAHSIKDALAYDFGISDIDIGLPFGINGNPYPDDLVLCCEEDIFNTINDSRYSLIITDPLINALANGKRNVRFVDMAQYAISSKYYTHCNIDYISKNFNKNFMKKIK